MSSLVFAQVVHVLRGEAVLKSRRAGCAVAPPGRGASSVEKRGERAWDPRSYHVSTASQRIMVAAPLAGPAPRGVGAETRRRG